MQILNSIDERLSSAKALKQTKINKYFMYKNQFLSYSDNFVSVCLDRSFTGVTRFNVGGFYLDSSIDDKIKSLPVFSLVLQRHDAKETYVSCFYAATYPDLFERLNSLKDLTGDNAFFFNWFQHELLVPNCPEHRDEISNSVYYNEGKFFDYRVFDPTELENDIRRSIIHSDYFCSKATFKRGFIKRNKFYRRKYDWFLKQYA